MKRIISFLLVICLGLSLTACGVKDSGATSHDNDDNYPITITDQAGREISIESKPERMVSCYYITTSLLIALGCQDRLAGVEDNAGKRPIYGKSAPEILNLPAVGSPKEFNLEACAALEPDLVILPLRIKDMAAKLEELGVKVMLVDPESQDKLLEMIELVATATGTQDKGRELRVFIKEQEEMLADTLKDADRCSVYLSGNSDFLTTASREMYQSSLIRMAGGINVADEIDDTYWATTSYEQVLKWNPSYIILASDAKYSIEDVLCDPNLAGCDAVKNKQVFKIPSDLEAWDSPVPGSILGAVWLANVLHGDKIAEEQVDKLIGEYYEAFYGFSYEK